MWYWILLKGDLNKNTNLDASTRGLIYLNNTQNRTSFVIDLSFKKELVIISNYFYY